MKHVPTINNEIINYLINIQDRASYEANVFANELTDDQNQDRTLPGKQVISNILNYARAMQVVNNTTGEKFILLQN